MAAHGSSPEALAKQTAALLHLARNPVTSKTQTYRGQKKGITAWAKRMRKATKGHY